ncbi:MAG: SDR family NAD(P)-dependent oxidoreductase, partial [Comamonas sp.]
MTSTHTSASTTPRPRVLITGGGAGIGAAAAQRCREDGYEPVIIDRVVDHIPGAIQADLSDPQDTARALNEALKDGPITRLINNVGVVVPNDAASQTLAEFDLAMSLNLRCAFQCMQALLPGMQAAGFGRIVNMSSRAALGKDLRTAYAASKAGLIG